MIRQCNEKKSMSITHEHQERETNKGVGNVRHEIYWQGREKGDRLTAWCRYGDEGVGWLYAKLEEEC